MGAAHHHRRQQIAAAGNRTSSRLNNAKSAILPWQLRRRLIARR